jgi:trans-aconitate 2-methyltransferase
MPAWDDEQYLKFADERTRPARELLARVPLQAAERVVDLGCGPGNSTALLHERWPGARVTGVDSSAEMLQRARADLPQLEWQHADVGRFVADAPLDVLFGNAVLQWLPEHRVLLPRLFAQVRSGGVLAVQMPHNFAEPSHRWMRELPGPWQARMSGVRAHSPVEDAGFYYDLLAPEARHVDLWLTRYEHVMDSAESIVEWVKGTGLRPFLDMLEAKERPPFLSDYTRALDAAYPARSDGKRLFSFPRLFIVAVRS